MVTCILPHITANTSTVIWDCQSSSVLGSDTVQHDRTALTLGKVMPKYNASQNATIFTVFTIETSNLTTIPKRQNISYQRKFCYLVRSPCWVRFLEIWNINTQNIKLAPQSYEGCDTAHVVSRWLLTMQDQLQPHCDPCGICGTQSSTVTGFSRALQVSPVNFIPSLHHSHSSIIWGLCNRAFCRMQCH